MMIRIAPGAKTWKLVSSFVVFFAVCMPCQRLIAVPIAPPVDQGVPHSSTPVPLSPEPKIYVAAGGSGSATGNPVVYSSGGDTCWPVSPSGSMSIGGGGEVVLDGKLVASLVIGDNPSKKSFEWKASPAPAKPSKKSKGKPTSWICAGSAKFEVGFSYSVGVAFQGKATPCGATTIVDKPSPISASYFAWTNDEKTTGTIFIPRIKTTTVATAKMNPNKWRKKIGVGEIVTCELSGAPDNATVVWIASSGTIEPNGRIATFTAGDENTTVAIAAAFTATIAGQQICRHRFSWTPDRATQTP